MSAYERLIGKKNIEVKPFECIKKPQTRQRKSIHLTLTLTNKNGIIKNKYYRSIRVKTAIISCFSDFICKNLMSSRAMTRDPESHWETLFFGKISILDPASSAGWQRGYLIRNQCIWEKRKQRSQFLHLFHPDALLQEIPIQWESPTQLITLVPIDALE